MSEKGIVRGRVEHVDIAKGISIAMVALFHSDLAFFIPAVVEPMSVFRMPLFLVNMRGFCRRDSRIAFSGKFKHFSRVI